MTETRDDPPETPLQREIKAAIYRIFELLGQQHPDVTMSAADPAQPPNPVLPEELRRGLAESMARKPPVAVPMSALQGGNGSPGLSGDRPDQDPEHRGREFLAALHRTIANLERIQEGLDPEGAEEVRKIYQRMVQGGEPDEPVN